MTPKADKGERSSEMPTTPKADKFLGILNGVMRDTLTVLAQDLDVAKQMISISYGFDHKLNRFGWFVVVRYPHKPVSFAFDADLMNAVQRVSNRAKGLEKVPQDEAWCVCVRVTDPATGSSYQILNSACPMHGG